MRSANILQPRFFCLVFAAPAKDVPFYKYALPRLSE